MNKNYYVYIHKDMEGNIFYVGKGLGKRAYSKSGRNSYWKRVIEKGYTVEIFMDKLSEDEAFELEIELISIYEPKCNFTKGGRGAVCRTPVTYTIEQIKKLERLLWRHSIKNNAGIKDLIIQAEACGYTEELKVLKGL